MNSLSNPVIGYYFRGQTLVFPIITYTFKDTDDWQRSFNIYNRIMIGVDKECELLCMKTLTLQTRMVCLLILWDTDGRSLIFSVTIVCE